MSTWDKMDREVWTKSEVMQELEKKLAHSTISLRDKLKKEVFKKEAGMEQIPGDLQKVNQEAGPAADNLDKVQEAVTNLGYADDDEEDGKVSEELEEELEEIAMNIIDELTKLSHILADNGDTSLAYKVERVIQDIELGFVQDED